tara:strand:+ start:311 stop:1018 length:708 start_codon:yes stop_codon:yes gene_type:complete
MANNTMSTTQIEAAKAKILADEARIKVAEAEIKTEKARIKTEKARIKTEETKIKKAMVKAEKAKIKKMKAFWVNLVRKKKHEIGKKLKKKALVLKRRIIGMNRIASVVMRERSIGIETPNICIGSALPLSKSVIQALVECVDRREKRKKDAIWKAEMDQEQLIWELRGNANSQLSKLPLALCEMIARKVLVTLRLPWQPYLESSSKLWEGFQSPKIEESNDRSMPRFGYPSILGH